MKGIVDEAGRSLLTLKVRSHSDTSDLVVWVDTAFDGELVVPLTEIQRLGLQQTAAVQATLADGTNVVLETYGCEIDWFGAWREIEVIANEGRFPLLGVGLLIGRKLAIDYRANDLVLE